MKNKKQILMTVCLMLVVCIASVGGTLAWLADATTPVVNTFTPAGIDIDLWETKNSDGTEEAVVTDWSAELVPGKTYPKNPKVEVKRPITDVDVYLFVKVDVEKNTFDGGKAILQYELNTTGWTQGDGTSIPANVWYRTVLANEANPSYWLLKDNQVTVNPELTDELMPAATATPKMTFTAYAIQTEGMTGAADAWTKVNAI